MSERIYQVLYAKYNSVRRPEFRVTTEICEGPEGIFVRKRAGSKEAGAHLEAIAENAARMKDCYRGIQVIPVVKGEGELRFPYINGQTLAEQIDVQHFERERFVDQVNRQIADLPVHDRRIGSRDAVKESFRIRINISFNVECEAFNIC